MKGHLRIAMPLVVIALFLQSVASAGDSYQECTSSISGNFNGTAIDESNYLWFTSVFKLNGQVSSPVTLYATHGTITFTANGKAYTIIVPNSVITFSPTVTLATNDFQHLSQKSLGIGWNTQLQSSGLAGNDLSQAVRFEVPAGGLPGGIKNVSWQTTFSSFTSNLSVNWQWAAAVYTQFIADYDALAVKPVDDNKASQYQNSDHAGTPENYKTFVIGGASGGGGSNYTGSLSATASCALTTDGSVSFTTSQTP
jgi:hypothetical protein